MDSTATSAPRTPRTPRRTCKDEAMVKILECFKKLSTSPKAKATPLSSVACRHTEKVHSATSLSRQKGSSLHSSEASFSPSENVSSSEEFDSEEISSEEDPTSPTTSTDTSDDKWVRRTRPRRRKTRRPAQTSVSDQAFFPRRTTSAIIDRETLNAKLHASRLSNDCLPCREKEFDAIFEFLFEHLQNGTGGCLYISGVPGTGKTATVTAVARSMAGCVDEDGNSVIPPFKFVTVNGMQVSQPHQIYAQIYEVSCHESPLLSIHVDCGIFGLREHASVWDSNQDGCLCGRSSVSALKGEKASAYKAMSLLEAEFCSAPRQRGNSTAPACILLLDELDLLCSRRQDVLYALFDWTCRSSVGVGDRKRCGRRILIVLAVANTMDLPERVLHHRVASRLGLNRLAFAPYSHEQLAAIVNARLGSELGSSFDPKAIELATRKVAAVSGDARRALDICRRAAELAQLEGGQKATTTMQHVNAALREMFTSLGLTALRSVSHYERLLLRAIVAEVAAQGVEEVPLNRCLQQLHVLCNLEVGLLAMENALKERDRKQHNAGNLRLDLKRV
ncbi:Origin recognition complex subunit [Echinococcus granulosus]|uniref:Origin recognition complex subunit 1 n=1 Tax=Echinococcus granulosus TaxID=6210 RepID=W6UCV1_ECHGR|nr:Origin recognition complex subunit [Echinococcus granulosus]EUB58586.1 Origin recognition complex subunit [Echinococcus granulosus]